jgi:dienelactone hydrolase
VLLVQDSLGVDGRSLPYAIQLEGAGFLVLEMELRTLSLDGSGPAEDTPAGATEVAKVLRTLVALARHPAVDPQRLAAVGFGAGGRALALATQTAHGPDLLAARVLLYPGCEGLRQTLLARAPAPRSPSPVLLLHGEADPVNTRAACNALADTLEESASTVRIIRYPHATYGWDVAAPAERDTSRQPRPDGSGRVFTRSWPALAGMSASQTAGFLASVLAGTGQ